jgi:hypothetical protein
MRSAPPAKQCPSIARAAINSWVVFGFLVVYVHLHAKVKFTTQLFASRMELWALFLIGVCIASAVAVSLLHEGIGQRCRPALGSQETSAQISSYAERVEPPFSGHSSSDNSGAQPQTAHSNH